MIIFTDIEIVKDSEFDIDNYEKYGDRSGFMPEFNKILCIVVGTEKNGDILTKILKGDEKEMIEEFFSIISKNLNTYICGFNIVNFDIPFIIKRAIKLGIIIPDVFKIYGKPKRELKYFIDLKEVYSYGVFGNNGNLDLVCKFLGITSPKDEGIDGSLVQKYYDDGKEEEIYEYCVRDVVSTIRIYEYFKKFNLI